MSLKEKLFKHKFILIALISFVIALVILLVGKPINKNNYDTFDYDKIKVVMAKVIDKKEDIGKYKIYVKYNNTKFFLEDSNKESYEKYEIGNNYPFYTTNYKRIFCTEKGLAKYESVWVLYPLGYLFLIIGFVFTVISIIKRPKKEEESLE